MYIDIHKDYYHIEINNEIFHQMLGKYDSVMTIFYIMGFKRTYKHVTSSFSYIRDQNYDEIDEMLHAWCQNDEDENTLNIPSAL